MDEGRNFPLPVTQGVTQGWVGDDQAVPACGGPQGGPLRAGASGGRATFITIATADRAAQSRILARSARQCHPEARLVVLALDPGATGRMLADLYDVVIAVEELSLGGLADMQFRYSLAELCFALKPWVIRHLLKRFAGDPVYYFDSDIELFTPLAEAAAALAEGATLVLTPHILQPGLDRVRERAVLLAGSFNAGFVAVAPSAPARAFVEWWCDRVRTGCTHDPQEGTHGDQKWLDLAPSICDGVTILRHPGYNFAYWNAHERPLSCLGGAWSAAGWPLRFVHYSLWNLREEDAEQYLARHFPTEYRPFTGLFAEYRKKVEDEGPFCAADLPGAAAERRPPAPEAVPEVVRRAFARYGPAVDGDGAAVFARAVDILNAPSGAHRDLPDLPITILYDEIWQRHGDLRYRFAVDRERGRLSYLRWLVELGATELAIPAIFLVSARATVDRARLRELEAGDEEAGTPAAIGDPGVPALPAAADTLASLIVARDTDRDRITRQQADIRLLARSNKGLRREVLGLRVHRWRDEERIQALDKELAQTREARDAATRRSRDLAAEIATLRSGFRLRFADWFARPPQPVPAEPARPEILGGEAPFFKRGFLVGETAASGTATVKRIKNAPSGTMIFGPYLTLPAGRYAATIDARLYRRLPVSANFTVEVVCDGAQRVVERRRFRLYSLAGWRRFEVVFRVWDGEDYPDFEIRIWARRGTPLEIARIDLHELTDKTATAPAT